MSVYHDVKDKILTISIAAYNVEQYISKAIETCILKSKNKNYIEVIVVNDGSNDRTSQIAHLYEVKYPQIVTVIDKENGGYGSTINCSLRHAHGKYFRLLDGDDWFVTDTLDALISELKQCEEDIVFTDSLCDYGKKKKIAKIELPIGNTIKIDDISEKTNFQMQNMTYKTSILKNSNIVISEKCFYTDMEFVIMPLPYVKNIRYLDKVLYVYRLNVPAQSVSINGIKKHYKDSQKVLYKLLANIGLSKSPLYQYQIALFAKKVIGNYLIADDYKNVKEDIRRIDLDILKTDKSIYRFMKNKTIWCLRKSDYKLSHIVKLIYVLVNIR